MLSKDIAAIQCTSCGPQALCSVQKYIDFLTLSELMYLPNLQSGRIRTRIIQVYKDGQLDFSEASDRISDYLTLKYLLKTY